MFRTSFGLYSYQNCLFVQVEQTHKIFKLCGSPTEAFWKKTKLPLASSFRSQRVYKRSVSQTFKDFPPSTLALLEVLLSIDPQERGTASSALNSGVYISLSHYSNKTRY